MSTPFEAPNVTLRQADYGDTRALLRLAALDSAAVPDAPVLLAEVEGEVVAAVPIHGGRPLADPFRRTREVVAMLELRAAQLASEAPARSAVARLRLALSR